MLIFISIIVVLVVGIILTVFGEKRYRDDPWDDVMLGTGLSLLVLSLLTIIVLSIAAIDINTRDDYRFERLEAKRASLELRLDEMECAPEKSIVEVNSLYSDIYSYNMEVKAYKYWNDSLWTNWLYSDKIANESKYVEIGA